jgi:hypothetical protein
MQGMKRMTRSFIRYALDLLQFGTIKDVANHVGMGWDAIKEIHKEALARISHTFSDSSHALHDDLASQVGEAVLLEHCLHPLERQSQSAERRSVQKKCEKSGLGQNLYVSC